MAQELGVELAELEGSGPGGRIVKADVEAAADGEAARRRGGAREGKAEPAEDEPSRSASAARPAPRARSEYHELTRLQQTVTRRMAESKATAPDFAISLEVDMTLAVELRKRLKEVTDPAPSFNDMIVKACAMALTEHPRVNGAYRDGKFELYSNANVGVAVAAQDSLVVPTIFDADSQVAGPDLARRARADPEGARQEDHAAGGVGRHLHGLEPRHVRHRALHGDHQPAPGRAAHRGRAGEEAGSRRRRAGSWRATSSR